MFPYGRSIMASSIPAPSVGRSFPVEYFVLSGVTFKDAVVGSLGGRPIHDVAVDANGKRYRFVGAASRQRDGRYNVLGLREGEWIVEPGLVYRSE